MSTAPENTLSAVWILTESPSAPAFFSSDFALSGSYSRCGMSAGKYGCTGAMWKSLPMVAAPNAILSMISWRFIDSFSALRTSTLSNGAVSQNIGMVIAAPDGTLSTRMFGERFRSDRVFNSTREMQSTSPVTSAV
jgi:hypothetical protein